MWIVKRNFKRSCTSETQNLARSQPYGTPVDLKLADSIGDSSGGQTYLITFPFVSMFQRKSKEVFISNKIMLLSIVKMFRKKRTWKDSFGLQSVMERVRLDFIQGQSPSLDKLCRDINEKHLMWRFSLTFTIPQVMIKQWCVLYGLRAL